VIFVMFWVWVFLVALVDCSARVQFKGRQLYVDNKPFEVRGVCYSPVPIGESPSYLPYGDYFTAKYAYMWSRDVPVMKAMGVNTVRIYGWDNSADHSLFLDYLSSMDMYVLITYYLGTAHESPVNNATARNAIVTSFAEQVARYAGHSAVLMWSFGNELNGVWNGFVTAFSDANQCGWTPSCLNNQDYRSHCVPQADCMYAGLFKWVNEAAAAAKAKADIPVVTGFADVDWMIGSTNHTLDKLKRNERFAPAVSAWGLQLYRGPTFTNAFSTFESASNRGLLVTEYGVDAYNDPCVWPENVHNNMCFNVLGDPAGGASAPPGLPFVGCKDTKQWCHVPGEVAQAEWGKNLTQELIRASTEAGGVVAGGFIMAWADEYWKNTAVQDMCRTPCPSADIDKCRGADRAKYSIGGSAACAQFSHITCGDANTSYHDLCGYALGSAPDGYVNEAWFGLLQPNTCGVEVGGGFRLDVVVPRPITGALAGLWGASISSINSSFSSCQDLKPCYDCLMAHTDEQLAETTACHVACFGKSDLNPADNWTTVYIVVGVASGAACVFVVCIFIAYNRKTKFLAEYNSSLL